MEKIFEEVPVEQLRWRCDPGGLPFETTENIQPCDDIIGQERALESIRVGLDINSLGYNIFVTGLAGTGRFTTIKCVLEDLDVKGKIPNDICYVNNFKNPDMPHMLSLPAGQGNGFKKEMETLIETLKKKIPLVFENETYLNKKKEVVEKYRNKQAEMFREFEKKVNKEGFALVQIQMGPYSRPGIFPVVEGNPVNIEQLETMVEEDKFSREELEEERRLCYVGMTRAKQKLCFTFARRRLYFGLSSSNAVSRFLGEIDEDLLEPVLKDENAIINVNDY